MGIAMSVNNQHLMYRKDIFDNLGISEPKTHDDVLAAAEKIKAANVVIIRLVQHISQVGI